MMAEHAINVVPTATYFPEKPAPVMNSQGEVIEVPEPTTLEQKPTLQEEVPQQQIGPFDDVIGLGDTEFALAADALMAPTDDTGMVHEIISCGHVLKSTHDLARWSEKTGARRVNTQESIDAVTDLAINLEPNRAIRRRPNNSNNTRQGSDPAADVQRLFAENRGRGARRSNNRKQQQWQPVEGSSEKSEVINCWPVLKSTHDQAQLSEKRGKNAVNKAEGCADALDELACSNKTTQQQQGGQSQIINSWPILKSTHNEATESEQSGLLNKGTECLAEIIQSGLQAGGSNLQSGMDTQGGSCIQMDNKQ